jgi:3-oxoacyl-[acyl-carrier protein] reductase
VALVAASSRGLGRAVAVALATEGAKVMVSARDEAILRETAKEVGEVTGAEVVYQVADLSRTNDIRALVGRIAEQLGAMDILVTNAGGPPAGTFDTGGDEYWWGAFGLNLMSVVRLVRETVRYMRERIGGVSLTSPPPSSNPLRTSSSPILSAPA